MRIRPVILGVVQALGLLTQAWAQSPPVDAGQLLEQQRRLEPAPRLLPPAAVLEATPSPAKTPATPLPGATPETQTQVKSFALRGNTLLSTVDLQLVLQPWVNRAMGLSELRDAAAALEQHYRERGWLATVTLPAQDITEGTVLLEVAEAKMGRLIFKDEGNSKPVSLKLTERMTSLMERDLPSDAPLNLQALERALLIAGDLPGVRVSGSLQASELPGSTDVLVLRLADDVVLRGDISTDNGGSRSTGPERLNTQLMLNSPWGLGEQLSLSMSHTRGSDYLRMSATMPIGSEGWNGWRVGVNASALRYRVLDSMNSTTGLPPEGNTQTYGAELQYPLVRTALSNWQLTFGYEDRRSNNEDDNQTLNTLNVTSHARTQAFNAGISGTTFDRWAGGGSITAGLTLTSANLSLDDSSPQHIADDLQTARTQGNFQKLRWQASRLQTLETDWSLLASGSGQLANKNLDSGEKFYLGGMNGVRAYPSGEAGGSNGQQVTFELRKQLDPQWLLGAFFDWGQVEQYATNQRLGGGELLAANNTVTLKGSGMSLSWRADRGSQLKATWARRIGSNPLMTPAGTDSDASLIKDRFWLSANAPF